MAYSLTHHRIHVGAIDVPETPYAMLLGQVTVKTVSSKVLCMDGSAQRGNNTACFARCATSNAAGFADRHGVDVFPVVARVTGDDTGLKNTSIYVLFRARHIA